MASSDQQHPIVTSLITELQRIDREALEQARELYRGFAGKLTPAQRAELRANVEQPDPAEGSRFDVMLRSALRDALREYDEEPSGNWATAIALGIVKPLGATDDAGK